MNSQSVFVKSTKGNKGWTKVLDIQETPFGWQILTNVNGKEKMLDVDKHQYKELGYAPGLLFKQGGSSGMPISFGMVMRLKTPVHQQTKIAEYKEFFKDLISEDNKLRGGAGDSTAKEDVDATELAMGITVEMEHTDDEKIATEIALDHLTENPKYYSTLKKTGLAPELNDMSASSGLGEPDHVINKPSRQGHDQTPDAGNNVVGKIHSTPPVEGTDGKDLKECYTKIPNKQRNLVGSMATTDTGDTGVLGHRSVDKVSPSLIGKFEGIKRIQENDTTDMILAAPSLESALKRLVGVPLSKIQDKVSYMNLYLGNKYGIGGMVPPKEELVQRFLNGLVTWLFQKKVWPTNHVFDKQIEDAKTGKMSSEFLDYMEKDKVIRMRIGDIAKKAIAAKTSTFQDPDYISARADRTALSDTHAWTNFERELRKEKDNMIRINTNKPVETVDITPLATDLPEAKKTYKGIQSAWKQIHSTITEMATISKSGKSVMADKTPLKGLKPESVQGNIVIFRVPTDGGLYVKGFTLIFFMDSDESAKDMKEGKLPYLMVPRGTFYSGGSPISDIWKKKFQKPGTEHILGVFEGNSNDEEIFVDMITVRPGYQRNSIATKMIAAIKREYPNAKVSTSSKTPQGEKFFKTITEGGAKMLGKGLTSDMHGKRWTIDAYDNQSKKGATPKIDESKVLKMMEDHAYPGNVGFEEVYKFFQIATPEQKTEFDKLVGEGKISAAWELIQSVVGVQLK